jgi:hypothetical protein
VFEIRIFLEKVPVNREAVDKEGINKRYRSERIILMSLKEYRKTLLSFINLPSWSHPVAVTLTLKQMFHSAVGSVRLTADHAKKNLRHFLNKLNRHYFKNAFDRHGKRLSVAPIMEVSHEGRLHYHLIIDKPDHVSAVQFGTDIRCLWQSTDWGYKEVHIHDHPNEGWLVYMTKPSQKPDYDLSIDWMNYHKA